MEEILASIRRIIADDQMLPLTRTNPPTTPRAEEQPRKMEAQMEQKTAPIEAPPARRETPSFPKGNVVERVEAPPEMTHIFEPVAPPREPAPSAARRPMEVETRAPQPAPSPARSAAGNDELLLSPTTGASVSSAFDALASTMFLQNTAMVEEAVREMLRPMLKQWLDNNLPVMVERLVRSEIERVARGGRS
jgi:cell pole-organizing protein PopZ